MGATAKVKVKKGGPNWKLRYGRKPTLSFSNGTSNMRIEERDAFTNHILNFGNIDKIAFFTGIITE
jgi:hypothetical protein